MIRNEQEFFEYEKNYFSQIKGCRPTKYEENFSLKDMCIVTKNSDTRRYLLMQNDYLVIRQLLLHNNLPEDIVKYFWYANLYKHNNLRDITMSCIDNIYLSKSIKNMYYLKNNIRKLLIYIYKNK